MAYNLSLPAERPPSSLIIPSRNRPKLLLETIESVLQGVELPQELIIVDQSSVPHPDLVNRPAYRGCEIRYIHSLSTGLSRGKNEGITKAANDIVVIIDDDMKVPENWYQSLIRALIQVGPQGIVTGRVLAGDGEIPNGFVPVLVESEQQHIYKGRIGTDVLAGGHMAMYRSVYQAVGQYDERLGAGTRFPAAEDNDYGYRLLSAGYSIVYAPQAVVYHRAWRKSDEYYALRRSYGRGKGGFYAKYTIRGDFHMLLRMLKDILLRLIRFPWRVLHRPSLAIGDLYYTWEVLIAYVEWLLIYGRQVHD